MKSNDIIMTFSLLCKNKVVDKPLDHMKNHELDKNRKISTPNSIKKQQKVVKKMQCIVLHYYITIIKKLKKIQKRLFIGFKKQQKIVLIVQYIILHFYTKMVKELN